MMGLPGNWLLLFFNFVFTQEIISRVKGATFYTSAVAAAAAAAVKIYVNVCLLLKPRVG